MRCALRPGQFPPAALYRMNAASQSKKILRAIELSQQIESLQGELDGLKTEFRAEAEREILDRGDKEPAGHAWTFTADGGCACKVSFPSAGLVRELVFLKDVAHRYLPDPEKAGKKILSPLGIDLKDICGPAFGKLFAPYFKPAKAFEELVRAMVSPEAKAAKLLKALEEPPGTARVNFEVKA